MHMARQHLAGAGSSVRYAVKSLRSDFLMHATDPSGNDLQHGSAPLERDELVDEGPELHAPAPLFAEREGMVDGGGFQISPIAKGALDRLSQVSHGQRW